VLNIYDALYKHQDEITHYRTAHEQAAAHAADGYARATGKVGVCLATSGPGATNLVTGIATAYMDSIPIVSITGNVSLSLLGKDSFQEVDIAGITMPITKHNYIVKDVNLLADTIRNAFYIAQSGRPGPVLIDIPKDITAQTAEYLFKEPEKLTRQNKGIREEDLIQASALINASQKPLVYAGGGIIASGSSEELLKLAELINAPVALSAMGLGGFPGNHPNFTGILGMHGTGASNFAATECDLFIAIGARFSDRAVSDASRFAKKAKILHLDIDPAEINKNVITAQSVTGDIKEILTRLIPLVEPADHKEWMQAIASKDQEHPLQYNRDILRPQYVIERLGQLFPDAIFVTEVGQHQMWACHYIKYNTPRSFISSGGLGTMGYGLGAAIGATIGRPDKQIINIAGDGCFRMNSIELVTVMEYNLPLIEVIINNHALGMVKQWQNLFYNKRFSQTDITPIIDFKKLAEAYQIKAYTVKTPDEMEAAFEEAKRLRGPVVINCDVGSDDNVFPMVPPGAGIDELVFE
jgi:acetolactate synthase-1/2/3 large subunit